jgi:hypothetical protein
MIKTDFGGVDHGRALAVRPGKMIVSASPT